MTPTLAAVVYPPMLIAVLFGCPWKAGKSGPHASLGWNVTAEFRAIAAIGHVLRSTFGNLGFAIRVSWPWMVFILLLQILSICLFPALQAALASGTARWSDFTPQVISVLAVTYLASFIAFSSIAVNWHRYILLDEEAEGWDRFRLDATVMRYMGNAILAQAITWGMMAIGAAALLVMAAALSVVMQEAVAGLVSGLLMLVFGLWCIAMAQRVFIKLPAVALGRTDYGFGDALADSRGVSFRLIGFVLMLLAIIVMCALLAAVPAYALGVYSGAMTISSQIALACIQFVVNWVMLIIGVTSLTSLYGIFVEGREV